MEIFSPLILRIAAFFTVVIVSVSSLFGGAQFEPKREDHYSGTGSHEAVSIVIPSDDEIIGNFRIWYPEGKTKCPAVIFLNGSGQKTAWFEEYFERFATFGIIAIGTDDINPGDGYSAGKALETLLSLNSNPESALYGKVNTKKIGIAGYSQGGAGALRSASVMPFADSFCTVAVISPSNEERAESKGWTYDSSKIKVPVLMVSGTEDDDAYGTITSLNQMQETFTKLQGPKALARKTGAGHQNARQETVGYIVAWMCWQLCGEIDAGLAFFGKKCEIVRNPAWQDADMQLGY